MGEEIATTDFSEIDFENFRANLYDETTLLADLFEQQALSAEGYTFGFEVEAWLLDHGYFPNPVNEPLLESLADPEVVPELSRFNVELNTPPRTFDGTPFSAARDSLDAVLARCNRVAHGLDTNIVTIGTLPTVRESDLSLANISPLKRYYALNHQLLRENGGRPLEIDIRGEDHLVTRHRDVMLEAACTSLQVHFKVPARLAHRYYNASMRISAPLLAASVNAPLLFDHRLWAETRIPLFEQSIALQGSGNGPARVTFGSGLLRDSLMECFQENQADYAVLLPIAFDAPAHELRHLRLHNGTIWRWNRPLVAYGDDGRAHLRIENRIMPAGPSTADMIANTAFYLGLAHDWARHDRAEGIDFDSARTNFYTAARDGLDARVRVDGAERPVRAWLQDVLIDHANDGLAALGVARSDRDDFLDIIRARVATGQTGTAWQRAYHARNGGDAMTLVAAYCERQRSGLPVHEWAL